MTELDAADWGLIDRYLAGECSEADVRSVVGRLATDAVFRAAVNSAQCVRAAGHDPAPDWNLDRVWRGVVRDTAAARDPVRIRLTRPRSTHAPRWFAAAAVLIAAGGTWAFARVEHGHDRRPLDRDLRTYVTAVGERATISLGDGTEVTLAPTSRLAVSSAYGVSGRQVDLEGEATFVVVHDIRLPFIVRTTQGEARDIGTTFDVAAYADAQPMRIAVLVGRVDVQGVAVTPGQVAVVSRHGRPAVRSVAHVEDYLGWRTGRLVFDSTSVADVARTLDRWYDVDVRVPDPGLAGMHITATYTNAPLEEVLRSLAATLNARLNRQGHIVTLTTFGRPDE